MSATFESEKNRKAFIYTAIICTCLLLLFILISWKVMPPTVPVVQDLMEINLGNNEEGFGKEQPLKKGNRTPSHENIPVPKQAAARPAEEEKVNPDENAEEKAAPVNKPVKNTPKVKTEKAVVPVIAPAPKPQKPKITYNGPGNGPAGNNPTQDNGYTYQGNKPGGKGDNGDPNGDKDSYGNTPGGKKGGPRIISGNRKITRFYSFNGDLPKATVNAVVKVSAAGQGRFVSFAKGSTQTSQAYADAISNYLRNMQFDKASEESTVTVQFNFVVN
ncbi:MAG: hypothetical protein QM737_03365 [Ferruginibacter sp.]